MKFQDFAPPVTFVDSPEVVDHSIKHCWDARYLGVDTETLGLLKDETGKDYFNMTDQVVVMGLCPDEDSRYLVPRKYLHHYKEVLARPTSKCLTNPKFDAHRLANSAGIVLGRRWWDTVHMDFLVDEDTRENHHGLKDCMNDYFGLHMRDYKELFGKEDPRNILPGHPLWDKYEDYASLDPWASRKLALHLHDKLSRIHIDLDERGNPDSDRTLRDLYWAYDEPQMRALFDMERLGIRINTEQIDKLSKSLVEETERVAYEICKLAGEAINPNSPKQLIHYLFEKKGYEPLTYTKKNKDPSVDEATLNHFAFGKAQDPICKLVLQFRAANKIRSTYADGLLYYLYKDGRVHTSFSTTKTTGRLGSSEPNLQNIPQPGTDPHNIREAFIPAEGHTFLVCDYSQLEMRILAEICQDPTMVEAINGGFDMHSFTASKVKGMPYDDFIKAKKAGEKWASDIRTALKRSGFGIVYGTTKYGLAAQLSSDLDRFVSDSEAQGYIDLWLGTFPNVREYMSDYQGRAMRLGYVQTITGRFRRLSKAQHGDKGERGHALRQAINAPIQGTAADIVKIALVNLSTDARLQDLGFRLVHQVHDELLAECPIENAEEALEIMKNFMENPFFEPFSVPLTVDPKSVANWKLAK